MALESWDMASGTAQPVSKSKGRQSLAGRSVMSYESTLEKWLRIVFVLLAMPRLRLQQFRMIGLEKTVGLTASEKNEAHVRSRDTPDENR